MDVSTTILSLAGIQRPAGFGRARPGTLFDARDVSPLVLDADALDALPAMSELGQMASLRTEKTKLITRPDSDGENELYDLLVDPYETRNLIDEPRMSGVAEVFALNP